MDIQHINLSNLKFIEDLYNKYLNDPNSVDSSWRYFFEGMVLGSFMQGFEQDSSKYSDYRIFNLIQGYRFYGHKAANFNPINQHFINAEEVEELKNQHFRFTKEELKKEFFTYGFLKEKSASLQGLIKALQKTYCSSIGLEYMGIQGSEFEKFIQKKIEPFFKFSLKKEEKHLILDFLNKAEVLESFIHIKYPGAKRFSIEGGETLIPLISELIAEGSKEGVEQIVLGMAHRGRLNVLSNILEKSYTDIFKEFEGIYVPSSFEGSGDVKYHKGYTKKLITRHGKSIHISLCDNPSHLESIDPVVEGKTRAQQEMGLKGKFAKNQTVPLLIHGDAAIAGQGVVYETMQLSKLKGYKTGGTIHIIINNQVGFTANPSETKSTHYCTDIAKSFGAPVFHVNAEDPESCVVSAQLAMQLRQRFGCDVMIELNCYRKYGHNETDEPAYTQPKVYELIKNKDSLRKIYQEKLIAEGSLSQKEGEELEDAFKETLEEALLSIKEIKKDPDPVEKMDLLSSVKTALPVKVLKELAEIFCTLPKGFQVHRKLNRLLSDRLKILDQIEAPILDWGMAEHLAYASLLSEGVHVRVSGQDSGRGTFSHRHAILVDQEDEKKYIPLQHLSKNQAPFHVYNSPLSEYAVMGFEYGYSITYKNSLVIWEAQFGDFANGAQIIIDQFIVASEQKWGGTCPLTLFLPHGHEGQGPEHSSARIERYLQLAGNDSLYIVMPSNPAQFFHILRRQGISEIKKPLILFTPKALLRYPPSFSSPELLEKGCFKEVIDDPFVLLSNVKRLIFCSGKIYYDLIQKRQRDDIAIVRIEQLYPLHLEKIQEMIIKYNKICECFWVQEEHANQGIWNYIARPLQNLLSKKLTLRYVGRERSASTAAGSIALHKVELEKILKEALE